MLIIIDKTFGNGGEEEEGPIHRFWYNLQQQDLIFSNGLGMLFKRSLYSKNFLRLCIAAKGVRNVHFGALLENLRVLSSSPWDATTGFP